MSDIVPGDRVQRTHGVKDCGTVVYVDFPGIDGCPYFVDWDLCIGTEACSRDEISLLSLVSFETYSEPLLVDIEAMEETIRIEQEIDSIRFRRRWTIW